MLSSISGVDLVVISRGLNIHSDALPSYNTDLPDDKTEDIFNALKKRIDENLDAVMIDKSLAFIEGRPNLQTCVSNLITSVATGGVNGSLYAFSASDISQNGAAATTIANSNYCTAPGKITIRKVPKEEGSDELVEDSTDPYYPVWKEIYDENSIRGILGESLLTNTDINEATCIRYILNFKNQRVYNIKDKVTVLDIEPCSSNPTLDIGLLNDLLPDGAKYTEDNVEIVAMSVSEFVAKNEDFSENYDIIY